MSVSRPVAESARLAVAIRLKDPEREAIARRNLAEARIEKALSEAPPLQPDQIKHLSALLRTGGSK